MGNQLAPLSQPDYHNLPELGTRVVFEERLGGGQFLKSIKVLSEDGLLVVKVYFKRETALGTLSKYEDALNIVRNRLTVSGASNVMPFRWFHETPHAAYLARQFVHSSLLTRLSTPPFLTRIEKLWIAFQLLQALRQCHAEGICHGDIKMENVLLTSSGWLFLTDLANFKPAVIAYDNPADFNYFFASSSEHSSRRC